MTHVRFATDDGSDDNGAEPMEDENSPPQLPPDSQAAARPPAISAAPDSLRVGKVIPVSGAPQNDPDYIFDIVANGDFSAIAASLSTHHVAVYDPATCVRSRACGPHAARITDVRFPDAAQPNMLASSSADGAVRLWDLRAAAHGEVQAIRAPPGDELWSFDVGGSTGHLLAAGAEAKILCWDLRTQRQLAVLEEAHAEAVTQVAGLGA